MSSSAASAPVRNALRRFQRNQRGSSAVEFALVAPVFLALLFAIIETALVFFAGQVLETGVQDTGRRLYTSQATSGTDFRQALCDRVSLIVPCSSSLCVDVRSYPPGAAISITNPIDDSGKYTPDCVYQPPTSLDQTVVVRAFYPWPLFVTGLGYNIANIGGGSSTSQKLLAATAAFRPQ
jgi:Flp pilus assembly protein TadG